jgi:ribulose bisphosphate carboxylase small subunit
MNQTANFLDTVNQEDEIQPRKKSWIYKKLGLFNEKKVREVMNEVIAKNRNIPIMAASNEQRVRASEVKIILERFK